MTDRADESYQLTPEAKLRLDLRGVSLEDSIPLIRAYGDERERRAFEAGYAAGFGCEPEFLDDVDLSQCYEDWRQRHD